MNDEIKEILDKLQYGFCSQLTYEKLLDYIINLQQENERLNKQLKHYWKYRNDTEQKKEVYDILELGKDLKNLHKHKNTGGLLWIDLPMTLFSSLTSYIRARDVMLEDYKSRCEKAVEYINYYGTTPEENDDTTCRHILKSLLNILNGRSDE